MIPPIFREPPRPPRRVVGVLVGAAIVLAFLWCIGGLYVH